MSVLHKYKNKSALVIGGTGFIGTCLSTKLATLGCDVSILSRSIITQPLLYRHFKGDINDHNFLKKSLSRKVDIIFHCAGFSGVINSFRQPYSSFYNNVVATLKILESVRLNSPKSRLILIGSRLEYGKAIKLPVDETHPTNPFSLYGLDKLTISKYAMRYYTDYGIPVTILRPSNIYGPHQQFKFNRYNVINYMIDQAKLGKNLVIFGGGNQIRDYLFVDDYIDALLLSGLSSRAIGQIYNIGYGKPIKLKEMVTIIAKEFNVKIEYKSWPTDYKSFETGDFYSDNIKIYKHINWSPRITPEDDIKLCRPI